jgi:hypothetical protein
MVCAFFADQTEVLTKMKNSSNPSRFILLSLMEYEIKNDRIETQAPAAGQVSTR